MDSQPLSIPVNDVGKAIGIGRSKVYQLIASGELKSFAIGRRRLVAVADLQAFVEQQRARASEAA